MERSEAPAWDPRWNTGASKTRPRPPVAFLSARSGRVANRCVKAKYRIVEFIGREIECGPYAKDPSEIGPIVRSVGWYVLDRNVEFVGSPTFGVGRSIPTNGGG